MSKVKIQQVQQGMILGASVYHPGTGNLLLKQGTRLIHSYIDKMMELNISEVEISDRFTLFLDIRENMQGILKECYQSMLKRVVSRNQERNMNDAGMQVLPMMEEAIHTICSNQTLVEVCVDMQVIDFEALVRTGVFISGYSMLVGALMGMNESELVSVGMAGLIHDVGLCEMYQLIREKEISPAMRSLWQEHPTYGYYMMIEKNIPREAAEMIYTHHEKFNGEGFPRGLKGEEIPLGGRIIALCADYEEAIRIREFLPYEAIEYIYGNSGISYDPSVVEIFTQNIPVYPLGGVVQLSTGDIGVVVNIRKNKGPRPVVRVQYNRVYKPITEPRLVDLGMEKTIFIKRIISY